MNSINIIGPLQVCIKSVNPNRFTIFVDGGLRHKVCEFPDSISIGDNDSGSADLDIPLSPDKDRGDLYFALKMMKARNYKKAELHGFVGGRLDHQMLLLGDLLRDSQEEETHFKIYEQETLRMEIFPSGSWTFAHVGEFSLFSIYEQLVSYKGDCKYPESKEYPQHLPVLSTQGLSNISYSEFTVETQRSSCLFYIQK
ncbi:MAG: hypothetical protein KC478_03155 [Bacteriovoracaceae bacterium]|nr:hypothetical protein [Bacteriovoracaceae bacterium]